MQYQVQDSFEKEIEEMQQRKKRKLDGQNSNVHPGCALYDKLMHSDDPESIMVYFDLNTVYYILLIFTTFRMN